MKLIEELRLWLKTNSRTELAYKLNYKSTNVIENWLFKGEIPRREEDRVREIIRQKPKKKEGE